MASTAASARDIWSLAVQASVWFVFGLTIWIDRDGPGELQLESISVALMKELGSQPIRKTRERCRGQSGKHSRAENPDLP